MTLLQRLCLLTCLWGLLLPGPASAESKPRSIVIIAGEKSHGPEGNRIHDYPWTARLLKASLEASNVRDKVAVSYVRDGWPKDPAVLDGANAVLIVSDGRDGELFAEAPHLASAERRAQVQKLVDRGCGLLTLHFSTFAADDAGPQVLDWTGGFFDWEQDGKRQWYSAIRTLEADVVPVGGSHPVLNGVRPFRMQEEFYYNIRFAPESKDADQPKRTGTDAFGPLTFSNGSKTIPLLNVPALDGRPELGNVVAWARERKGGGRGFGTTCGHFYNNWIHDDFRKLVLNALVWSAGAEVPAQGVDGPFLSRNAIASALKEPLDPATAGDAPEPVPATKTEPAKAPAAESRPAASKPPAAKPAAPKATAKAEPAPVKDDRPIRVLMFAGNEAHKWHNWEKTTPIIKKVLEIDPRITVDVTTNIEDLATKLPPGPDGQRPYDVVVQNYVNWHDGTPLSAQSKSAFIDFVDNGGGLIIVHFSNGAYHFSLPEAGDSDWPEYRKLVRRVWNHDGPEAKRSAHDPFRLFSLRPGKVKHDITKGLGSFKVTDELYFSQQGDEPIEPLLLARSALTKKDEPLAWAYDFGKGRVFQTLLGHSEQTYDTFEPREMLRRAVAWSAGRPVIQTPVDKDTSVPKKKVNHWGTDQVGFDWSEQDSEDDRWKNSEIGNFLASILPLNGEPTEKGLTIKIGSGHSGSGPKGAVLYDTGRGQMRAAWNGGFLRFHPRRYGLIEAPHPDGKPVYISARHAGFTADSGTDQPFHYRGLWRAGDRTILNWQIGDATFRESPWMYAVGEQPVVTRTIEASAGQTPTVIVLARLAETPILSEQGDFQIVSLIQGDEQVVFAVRKSPAASLQINGTGIELKFAPRTQTETVRVASLRRPASDSSSLSELLAQLPAVDSLDQLITNAPSQWTAPIVTKGQLGSNNQVYTVDTVTIPFENPYQAMFFVAGHDFLTPDVAAICTVHGDVWLVSGLSGDWSKLKWKRYATGLFQPLGMVVRKRLSPAPQEAANPKESLTSPFDLLVLCRDHIARLHDLNGDDEADYYEVFHEAVVTSPGGHDYVACLETDSIGRLYYAHATEGVVQVTPDGRHKNIVGTGYRNPNGLGVSPDGVITIAPQEGNWTPSSGIFEVHQGGYGGFGGPKIAPLRPLGYDAPLCWIPRRLDNSSGGQAWVTSDRWGPMEGRLLHLSYGQCTIHLVLREEIHGQGQGGTLKLPVSFESGVCRGRFSPFDGQLYVSGLRGWTTSATQDGCFQRMRYTGKPVHLPTSVATLKNGLMLTFTEPLDRNSAEDPDNYFAEQWNVTYRQEYGSPEFKISNPREEGRDPVEILSATLLEDQKSVFLEIADIQPVSQLSLSYTINAADGTQLDQTYVHTIHQVREAPFDPALITRRAPKGQLAADEEQRLRPGVQWWFSNRPLITSSEAGAPVGFDSATGTTQSTRTGRLFALKLGEGESPASYGVTGTSFHAVAEGYLHMPLKGEYTFSLAGAGVAALSINHQPVISAAPISEKSSVTVNLNKGYNHVRLTYASPENGPADVRVLWSSATAPLESLPPDALFTTAQTDEIAQADLIRKGHVLIDALHCAKCHEPTGQQPVVPIRQAPDLVGAGNRFQTGWLAAWILDPKAHRRDATMPALLQQIPEQDRKQAAADIAAFVASLSAAVPPESATAGKKPSAHRGQQLFEDLGCIVCHRLTPNEEIDDWNRQSLTEVAHKFQPGELKKFLLQPHAHFATSYMPDFRMTDQEAADLSTFLIEKSDAELPARIELAGDKTRGQKLFASVGCAQCHLTSPEGSLKPTVAALKGALPERGCLSSDIASARSSQHALPVPDFQLTDEQKAALIAAWPVPQQVSASDASKRLMKSMHCQACHDRDGVKSARMQIIAEESETGIAPEQMPALTWTGERLREDWMADFMAGKVQAKPREWLKTRMPAFPAYATAIAHGFAADHGMDSGSSEPASSTPQVVAAGQELMTAGGLDCRQCHGLGDAPPTGDRHTLLAPGINFSLIRNRIRPDFYHRWMLDPPRYDTNTRMPKLSPDGKTTKVTRFFDGNAHQQFDAIWQFLQQTPDQLKPAPAAGDKNAP